MKMYEVRGKYKDNSGEYWNFTFYTEAKNPGHAMQLAKKDLKETIPDAVDIKLFAEEYKSF